MIQYYKRFYICNVIRNVQQFLPKNSQRFFLKILQTDSRIYAERQVSQDALEGNIAYALCFLSSQILNFIIKLQSLRITVRDGSGRDN